MTAREVFGLNGTSKWKSYHVKIHISSLVGGIPKDPDTIRKWLKARIAADDVEIQKIAEETILAMKLEPGQYPDPDAVVDALLVTMKGNGFKVRDGELVWEGRCLKAAIREAAAVCYPGTKEWPGIPKDAEGKKESRKGLAAYLVERVEVRDQYIPLGRKTPDIAGEQRIKHVKTPQGPASAISVVDLVEDVTVSATIDVLNGDQCIPPKLWGELWEYVERGGVGADRARGDGRCELLTFEAVV
jgi:hypothetical protein